MGSMHERGSFIPDTTSAEEFSKYTSGNVIAVSRGKAWRNVRVLIVDLRSEQEPFKVPAVPEPFLSSLLSGEVEMQEREGNGPWVTTRVKKGSFFLTGSSGPYEVKWKSLSPHPVQSILVLLGLRVFKEALAEAFGKASQGAVRDVSGFSDRILQNLLEMLRVELSVRKPSALLIDGVAHAIAAHLVRHYMSGDPLTDNRPSLPGFKLRHVTAWMAEHIREEFRLCRVAEEAGISEFHFNRLFKQATGLPPSQYQITLRVNEARRLLTETGHSVIQVGLAVGYSNPSHFAQVFKKQTGLTPSQYRKQH
jgi:AraC family transcriptional regulator